MIKKSDSPMDGAYSSGVTPPRPPEGKPCDECRWRLDKIASRCGDLGEWGDAFTEQIHALHSLRAKLVAALEEVVEAGHSRMGPMHLEGLSYEQIKKFETLLREAVLSKEAATITDFKHSDTCWCQNDSRGSR